MGAILLGCNPTVTIKYNIFKNESVELEIIWSYLSVIFNFLGICICKSKSTTFGHHQPYFSFHLRCHGELLFKCGYCVYFHWQKRTAEKHVAEVHPDKKLFVRYDFIGFRKWLGNSL